MLPSNTEPSSLPTVQPLPHLPHRTDLEIAAKNRSVSAAVKLLNDLGAAGPSHEFSISIDPKTRQAIVRIVDASTREVIEQLPSEYLLKVAQQISEGLAKQSASSTDKAL